MAALILALPPAIASPPVGRLEVALSGLRSSHGRIHLCLTRDATHFPDCGGDPLARKLSSSAADPAPLVFADLPVGNYALSIVHDENGNSRLDTFAGIPREGFGFSRNPPLRFGPPRFDEARFTVTAATIRQAVRIKYIL